MTNVRAFESACLADRRSIDRLAKAIALLINVPRVLISIFHESHHIVLGAHTTGKRPVGDDELLDFGRDVATGRRPVMLQDARRRMKTDLDSDTFVACAGVPLPFADGVYTGAIAVCDITRRGWQDRDLLVLRCFADTVATIVELRASQHGPIAVDARRTLDLDTVHDPFLFLDEPSRS